MAWAFLTYELFKTKVVADLELCQNVFEAGNPFKKVSIFEEKKVSKVSKPHRSIPRFSL